MSIFNSKKAKEFDYDDNYDREFYRADSDEGAVGDVVEEIAPAAAPQKSAPAGAGALKVVKPHAPEDGLVIADYLINGFTVVMNIEALDRAIVIRLVDFLQGALHVLDGELRRVTKTTFVLTPNKGILTEEEFANEEE